MRKSIYMYIDLHCNCNMPFQWSYNSTTYTIASKLSGKCVDGSEYGTSDGTNIQVKAIIYKHNKTLN